MYRRNARVIFAAVFCADSQPRCYSSCPLLLSPTPNHTSKIRKSQPERDSSAGPRKACASSCTRPEHMELAPRRPVQHSRCCQLQSRHEWCCPERYISGHHHCRVVGCMCVRWGHCRCHRGTLMHRALILCLLKRRATLKSGSSVQYKEPFVWNFFSDVH